MFLNLKTRYWDWELEQFLVFLKPALLYVEFKKREKDYSFLALSPPNLKLSLWENSGPNSGTVSHNSAFLHSLSLSFVLSFFPSFRGLVFRAGQSSEFWIRGPAGPGETPPQRRNRREEPAGKHLRFLHSAPLCCRELWLSVGWGVGAVRLHTVELL